MTESFAINNIELYWNESLSEELLQFLTRRLNCPETAADVTQETFIRLYQFAKENIPDNARALAYKIAINLATDYQRKMQVRNKLIADIDISELADISASLAPDSEQIIMDKQRFQQFHAALEELPASCRHAFILHGIDGLTYDEIASQMDISVSMVYKHLARAIKHCKSRMDESE